MRTHNIRIFKKVNKKYTGCNLKTTEFHECALIGVCAVIRSNTVCSKTEVQPSLLVPHVVKLRVYSGLYYLEYFQNCTVFELAAFIYV